MVGILSNFKHPEMCFFFLFLQNKVSPRFGKIGRYECGGHFKNSFFGFVFERKVLIWFNGWKIFQIKAEKKVIRLVPIYAESGELDRREGLLFFLLSIAKIVWFFEILLLKVAVMVVMGARTEVQRFPDLRRFQSKICSNRSMDH